MQRQGKKRQNNLKIYSGLPRGGGFLPRSLLPCIPQPGRSRAEGSVPPVWGWAPQRSTFSKPGLCDVGEQRPSEKQLGVERGSGAASPISV